MESITVVAEEPQTFATNVEAEPMVDQWTWMARVFPAWKREEEETVDDSSQVHDGYSMYRCGVGHRLRFHSNGTIARGPDHGRRRQGSTDAEGVCRPSGR